MRCKLLPLSPSRRERSVGEAAHCCLWSRLTDVAGVCRSTAHLATVKKEVRGYRTRVDEQARIIEEYKARLEDHDKKFDESARKFTTILQVSAVLGGYGTGRDAERFIELAMLGLNGTTTAERCCYILVYTNSTANNLIREAIHR